MKLIKIILLLLLTFNAALFVSYAKIPEISSAKTDVKLLTIDNDFVRKIPDNSDCSY